MRRGTGFRVALCASRDPVFAKAAREQWGIMTPCKEEEPSVMEREEVMLEQTKEPTRDYAALSRDPWRLWDTLYGRRSHRKFLPGSAGEGLLEGLRELVGLAAEVRGAAAGTLLCVVDAPEVEEMKRRLHRGMQGKINLWLGRAPVLGFLALSLPREDVKSDRPRELPLACMAAEDAVLWLTEKGMGTCWLGGISQREARHSLGIGGERYVPAVIPFGLPKSQVRAMDFDHVLYRTISRKRRPLASIAGAERMGRPFVPRDTGGEKFSVSDRQDVRALLHSLREGGEGNAEAPPELAVEACLEAARVSPSAGNAQKWYFVAVLEENNLERLAGLCGWAADWQAAVVAAGDPDMSFLYERLEKPFWMIDVPIALSQMSLMAASMGFGVDVCVDGVDEAGINGLVGLEPPLRTVGVLGLR